MNQNTQSAANDLQNMFNPMRGSSVLKMWASMNERMSGLLVEAGTRSIDLMSDTSKEALSNLREVSQVRDEPAEYAQAYSDFAQKQMELLKRTAQDLGELSQNAGTETAELVSEASKDMSDEVASNAKDITDKVSEAGKDTTDKARTAVKTNV